MEEGFHGLGRVSLDFPCAGVKGGDSGGGDHEKVCREKNNRRRYLLWRASVSQAGGDATPLSGREGRQLPVRREMNYKVKLICFFASRVVI